MAGPKLVILRMGHAVISAAEGGGEKINFRDRQASLPPTQLSSFSIIMLPALENDIPKRKCGRL